MKKLFIVLALLTVFTSCSLFSQKDELPAATSDELTLEKKIGIIASSEGQELLATPTPYILLLETGEKIFVDSIDINFKKYVRRRVEAEGKWNDDHTIFVVGHVTSLGQETAAKQWYQSPAMGVKFQYPALWLVSETKNIVGLNKIVITPYEVSSDELSNTDHLIIERSENNRRLSAREWLNLNENYVSSDQNDAAAVFQESILGIAQLPGVKKTVGAGERIEFYVNRDTFIYRFMHATVGDADKDMYRNAFYDLMGSFEFIPFGESMGTSTALIAPQTKSDLNILSQQKNEQRELTEKTTEQQQKIADERQQFIEYIKENIGKLAEEASAVGGTWAVQVIAFAFPEGKPQLFDAAYVIYEDGHDLRKILLEISDRTRPESVRRVAYFKPGSATDWVLVSGTDTAKDEEKSLIQVADGSAELVVKKGMSLLGAKSFNIKIQYPANWYWAFVSKGYNFSNKPVSGENVLIRLTKDPETVPENMTKLGDMDGEIITEGEWAEAYSICLQGVAKYCLSGDPTNKDLMKQMLYTIVE